MPLPTDGLVALLDLENLVRDIPMGFTMHRRGRFFARGIHQTEDLTQIFVIPIAQIADPILMLHLQVLLMGSRGGFIGNPTALRWISIYSGMSPSLLWALPSNCYAMAWAVSMHHHGAAPRVVKE